MTEILFQRLERLLELGAQMLMLPGQLQRLTKVRRILVAVEARLVGGDLEQHATRRPEIDREEVVAIDHRSELVSSIEQRVAHFELGGTVLDCKRDVVHRPGPQHTMGYAR